MSTDPGKFGRDEVQWDRRVEATTYDTNENPVAGSETGFPTTVRCRLQVRRFRAQRTPGGEDVWCDACAFSSEYKTGRVGDLVTFRGVQYKVVGASPRSHPLESSVGFVRYDLATIRLGEDQA